MNKPKTIAQQFLSVLTDEQRGKVREYYRLVTDEDILPEDAIKRISAIWSSAEEDPILLSWLECIDFILDDEKEDECFENNKRAYLSEYLAHEVDLNDSANQHISKELQSKFIESVLEGQSVTLLLKCPGSDHHFFVSLESFPEHMETESFPESSNLKDRLCKVCKLKLSEHQIIKHQDAVLT